MSLVSRIANVFNSPQFELQNGPESIAYNDESRGYGVNEKRGERQSQKIRTVEEEEEGRPPYLHVCQISSSITICAD